MDLRKTVSEAPAPDRMTAPGLFPLRETRQRLVRDKSAILARDTPRQFTRPRPSGAGDRHAPAQAPCWCAMLGRAKAGVLPLSVFGALFASAARMIPHHPGFAAFRKSAKKDAFWKARERGCWRTHRGAQACSNSAADVAGYSRLMGKTSAVVAWNTLRRLTRHRRNWRRRFRCAASSVRLHCPLASRPHRFDQILTMQQA